MDRIYINWEVVKQEEVDEIPVQSFFNSDEAKETVKKAIENILRA